MSRTEIPRKVDSQEILVRSIKHPYHAKKDKPQDAAFTPRSGEKEISLLRLSFTTADFCKKHSVSLIRPEATPTESSAGLLLFRKPHVEEVCNEVDVKAEDESYPKVFVHGTPMDDASNYIAEGILVYTDDSGLPMHADLIYNVAPPEPGVPSNPIRKLAKTLVKKVVFKRDDELNKEHWTGDPLEM